MSDDRSSSPETLFARWLEAQERGVPSDVDAVCDAHPAQAEAFRALLAAHERQEVPPTVDIGAGGEAGDTWESFLAQLASRGPGFERFVKHGEIARGGMGAIHRVYDEDVRRPLAMKVMLGQDESAAADGSLGRFLEEAQVTGQLDHPGVVPVHEVGVDGDGRVYFTMKLVRGEDLRTVFEHVADPNDEEWTTTRALNVMLRVCEAMAYAHAKGVVHRDLKPGNVMVGRYGEAYVMDWGLAKVLGREDRHDLRLRPDSTESLRTDRREAAAATPDSPVITMDGAIVGTPSYMPPEQAKGRVEEIGPPADVYAVGAMLYHLLSGRMPYVGPGDRLSPRVVVAMVAQGPPAPLADVAPTAPAELVAIVDKAMAREVEDRYPDMTTLARDMRAFLEKRVVAAYETGAWAELKKWVVRNKGITATAAALVVVTLGLAISLTVQREAEFARVRADESRELADARAALLLRGSIESARERGDWDAVLGFLEEATPLDGLDDWNPRFWEVEALVATGERAAADALLDRLMSRPDAGLYQARLLLLRGDLAFDSADTAVFGEEMLRQALNLGLDDVDAAYARALLSPTMPELAARLGEVLDQRPLHFVARQRRIVAEFFLARFDDVRRDLGVLRTLNPDDASVVVIEVVVCSIEAGAMPTEAELAAVEGQLGKGAADAIAVVCRTFCLAKEAFAVGAPNGMMMLRLLPTLNALAGSATEGAGLGVFIPRLPAFENGLARVGSMLVALSLRNDPEAAFEMLDEIVDVNPEGTLLFLLGSSCLLTMPGDRMIRDSLAKAYLLRAADTPAFIMDIHRRALELVVRIDAHHWSAEQPGVRPELRTSGVRTLRRLWRLGDPDADATLFMVKHAFHFEEFSLCRLICTEELERFPEEAAYWRGRRGIAHCHEGNYGAALLDLDVALAEAPDDENVVKARALAAEKLGMVGPPGEAVPGAEYLGR